MSLYAIGQYHKELEKIIHYGGSKKETAIRNAFYNLLNEYARSKDLLLITEVSTKNKQGKLITPDGTLKRQHQKRLGLLGKQGRSRRYKRRNKKQVQQGLSF